MKIFNNYFFKWKEKLHVVDVHTSFPVRTCLASLTLAKFPFPIVFKIRYLPICG